MPRRLFARFAVVFAALLLLAPAALAQTVVPRPDDARPAPVITKLGHVEILGSGPIDMILIPGLYVDWTVYEEFMQRNASRYTMYAVTLPGFGGTGAPPIAAGQTYSSKRWLNNAVARIADLIDEHDMDRPVVVGHSLGGQIAMRMGAEHAGKVSKVINLDTLPAMPIPGRPQQVKTSQETRNQLIDTGWGPTMERQGELVWQQAQAVYMQGQMKDPERAKEIGAIASAVPKAIGARYFLELASQDLYDDIINMPTPMLTIAAKPDMGLMGGRPGSVPADWRYYKNRVKDASHLSFVEIHDAAHYITEDQPEELDQVISDYLGAE